MLRLLGPRILVKKKFLNVCWLTYGLPKSVYLQSQRGRHPMRKITLALLIAFMFGSGPLVISLCAPSHAPAHLQMASAR